ncbi:MAG: hypothetical protein A2X46_16980 [Lentisphaerae bacterium GWF2_57_35]|nr:MAG: hypothetical protein A2X46_16980 [Lentisphaerae bacterium GWF2_57_35]
MEAGWRNPALEQYVVGQYHGGAAMLLEDGEDVLEEVELLVAGRSAEIVAFMMSDSLELSPASLTMVTLLFFPKGGLARNSRYVNCST